MSRSAWMQSGSHRSSPSLTRIRMERPAMTKCKWYIREKSCQSSGAALCRGVFSCESRLDSSAIAVSSPRRCLMDRQAASR